ncbi:hypothetical protein HU200_031207 [Digitaria exilis]|uniref:Uncharacterized protein n=1 Tax=Digitaria exilis TaxID=1010633 RepID=A0A835BRC4_9POAL|nr:hypothetical protein HU200_031207 [Digitaria exilis]
MASGTTDPTMKIFINAEREVLFAVANQEALDFLYALLVFPDTAVSPDDATEHGCIDDLVDTSDEVRYLDGRPPSPVPVTVLQEEQKPRQARRFFLCWRRRGNGCDSYIAARSGLRCPSCGGKMDAEAPPGAPGAGGSGDAAAATAALAAGAMVLMDDLSLGPTLALLIVGHATLEEATVRLGRKEVRSSCLFSCLHGCTSYLGI